jgi:phosphohistidine swiveling domain-containing protein
MDQARARPGWARRERARMTPARLARVQAEAIHRQLRRLTAADPRQLSDFVVWSGIEKCLSEAPSWARSLPWHGPARKPPIDCRLFTPGALPWRSPLATALVDLEHLAALASREPLVVRWLATEPRSAGDCRRALAGTAFVAAFDDFVGRHGHRGACERDWARAGWREDPSLVIAALRRRVGTGTRLEDVAARLERRRADAAEAWQALGSGLAPWRRWVVRARARRTAREAHEHVHARERLRDEAAAVMAALRSWHLALADRFLERGWLRRRDDYFLLRLSEIAPVVCGSRPGPMLACAADSRFGGSGVGANQGYELPPVDDDALSVAPHAPSVPSAAGELRGLPLGAGSVEGPVVVARDPGDVSRMRVGAILVAPAIDAAWLPTLSLAAGIVLETGGFLSQGAVVARECGLPALGLVADATARLSTGDRIRMDATGGRAVLAARRAGVGTIHLSY